MIAMIVLAWIAGCGSSDRDPADQTNTGQTARATCSLLIQNVNVVDVVNAVVRKRQDVCIDGSDIVAVQTHAPNKFESDAVVSGSDKFLMPGLNDMHVHFRGGKDSAGENRDLLTLYLAHGITGVYDQGSDISNELITWRDEIENGELVGPDLYLTGPKIDGPDPWFAGSLVVETQSDVESAVVQLVALGVDGAKIMGGTLSVEAFWFALDAARTHGLQTISHVPATISATEAAERGLGAIAHLWAIVNDGALESIDIRNRIIAEEISSIEAMAEFGAKFDHTIMRRALERLEKTNTALITTYYGSWLMAGGLADELTDWEREHYRYAGPIIRESVENGFANDQSFAQEHQQIFQTQKTHLDWILAQLETTNILVLAGSDSGPRNSIPGRVLHREIELLVAAGLSPAYALRAATYNPAVFLGQADRAGLVGKGRLANMVLLEANPLDDISNIQLIVGVVKSGQFFSKSDIDAMMASLESKYSN